MEVTNRFKQLDLIDRVPEELWTEVCDTVQEVGINTISILGLFSSCGRQELLSSRGAWDSHGGVFSCRGAQALVCEGFSSCGTWALGHRLRSCGT